ncbi:MAG: hypothetical protein JST01_00050 [Cyanobacteria bacterium SZAS TMP-1]|nr:hypothetical protein [Cyanobacteria bacterium SZAS TMP-1]
MKSSGFALLLALALSLSVNGGAIAGMRDVDARQGALQESLRDAMEAGRLTDAKLHELKQELQKIADQEAVFKSKNGELSSLQKVQLRAAIDKVSKMLEAALNERNGDPVDVEARRQQLAQRLSEAHAAQKLTQAEYDRFFADLTTIDKQIALARGADGKIATNDQVSISLELDNLAQRFSAGEDKGHADLTLINQRKDDLRALIRKGVAEGHLTEDEVDDLRQQLYNYEAKEERMSNMGRPLTADEQLAMVLELERFGAEIRARMDNGNDIKISARTVTHRKTALDQTFANAVFAGDISLAEARDFKQGLDEITTTEQVLKNQNHGELTSEQIQDLLIAVEKLKGRFSRLTYNRSKVWTGVDGLVTSIRDQITNAVAARLLTSEENDALQSKIADVLVAKSNERNAPGLAMTDSALKLASELTDLSSEVTKEINAKGAKPKI